jgi:sec-independent protein translocase protein TatC
MASENKREVNETDDKPKPFLQHLEELRWTIIWCLSSVIAGMLVCLPFIRLVFKALCAPLAKVSSPPDFFLRSLEITGAFSIAFQIVLWGGLIISAPVCLVLMARFVFPGLTMLERKMARIWIVLALLFFVFGVALGYFITLPIALKIFFALHGWLGITAEWTAPNYISFCMRLLLLFGLAFEMPLIVMVLGYFGLITSAFLRRYRRHAVVAILILAMVLTPGPDVISQIIMTIPMLLLYELCIWTIRTFEGRKNTVQDVVNK